MAAGTWKLYRDAKKKLGNASTINLSATTFKLFLAKSTSNAVTDRLTLSTLASVSNLVASTSGYGATAGQALSAETWTTDAGSGYKFDCSVPVITALGSPIGSVMFGIIDTSGGTHLLAVASLSSAAFSIGAGSTLTITINASGVFALA
jgi:hypothetical protein